jgi:hypothetical protein
MPTNLERINRIEEVLDLVMNLTGDDDNESAVSDLLTDTMHYCQDQGFDFVKKLNVAILNYNEEANKSLPMIEET